MALLLTLLLIAFRIAISYLPDYRAQVQAWVSERTKLDIQFTRMDARLRFYGPELVFDSAVVRSGDGKRRLVSARQVSVGLDLWTALRTFRLATARITLQEPELQVVRTPDGRFEVVGQSDLPERDRSSPFRPDELPTGQLVVSDARVSFRDLKTGRGPWIVPGVSFDLRRTEGAMHIEGAAEMPAKLGKSLRFTADTEGQLAAAPALQWRFHIEARELDLAGWREISPKDLPAPPRGRGSFALGGSFNGQQLIDLSAQVQFTDVTLALPVWTTPIPAPATMETYIDTDALPDQSASAAEAARDAAQPASPAARTMPTQADYERIVFDLQLAHARQQESQSDDPASASQKTDRWTVQVKNLELTRAGSAWRRSNLDASLVVGPEGELSASLQSDLIVLDNVWPLLAYAPDTKNMAIVRALDAKGSIVALNASFARTSIEAAPKYSVQGRFVDLGFAPINKAPGIARFSGVVDGDEGGGSVDLNVRNGTLDLPKYFRTPLPADRIAGTLLWRPDNAGWRISATDLQIDAADGKASAAGEVFVPGGGKTPIVDVHAEGRDLDARAAPRYMPVSRMPPKTLEWLDQAFSAGKVPHAEFQMRGPVRDFPFRKNEGLFLIKARVTDLTLNYQPGWIPATDLVVDAEFRNVGMSAKLISGEINGMQVTGGTGRFADFKQAELVLDATVKGDLSQALPYVQQSPVGPEIGDQFMSLRGTGPIQAQAALRLPFKNIDARRVQIRADLSEGSVGTTYVSQTIDNLNGTLTIRDHALYSMALQGKFLGGPVSISGNVEGRYTGPGAGIVVTAQGRAQGAQLTKLAQLPAPLQLDGAMDWNFSAMSPRHPPGTPTQPVFRVESDTKGLAVLVPDPLRKAADVTRSLAAEVDATRENELLIRASYGDARALIRLRKGAEGWALDRGAVRADAVAASLPAHTGLRVEGVIPRFVLDDWLKIQGSGRPGKGRLADVLRAANVRVQNFSFLGFDVPDVRGLLQATESAYRIDVAGDAVAGQLTIPYELDSMPMQIALTKLDVPDRQGESGPGSGNADPRDIPGIVGRVDNLSLAGRPVGMARIVLEKTGQGARLATGELRGTSFTATARGSWMGNAASSRSSIVLDVASTDVADTLRAFNYSDLITGARANAHASLTWPGGIDEELLGRASGTVQIEMFDGQLLSVNPGGAGRMLGLLSIGALPRRLSLDFSDVTDRGFSFDKLHADFQLNDGDAFTNNLLLSGPQAEVGIVGRTGLGKRDYDQTAVVTGDIGGSLSVASAVVGGPVLGAAVLAFSRLFKEPLKGVTRRYYRITGPWENPAVERIDKAEARQESAEAAAAVSESQREDSEGTTPPAAPSQSETRAAESPATAAPALENP